MYKIIGQPINMRYISASKIVEAILSEEQQRIIKIGEFGYKYGYKPALDAFNIKKTTYYEYARQYKLYKEYGIAPSVKSKRPHNVRKANWNSRIVKFNKSSDLNFPIPAAEQRGITENFHYATVRC